MDEDEELEEDVVAVWLDDVGVWKCQIVGSTDDR